ncbi:hypothetical protein DNTS_032751 [Danionella cerebrum]|uniref:Glycoprotein hormone subunit beta domain-containing protein n=1 Tax=Danionella cerebrum TaxID=2873325 RepID=A0A553NW23_9TELE|nr:hypothetical protein DNTS_032751 [Danionella translucida]
MLSAYTGGDPCVPYTARPQGIPEFLEELLLALKSAVKKLPGETDPLLKIPFPSISQSVCTYGNVRYETVRLPDCLPGVDPLISFPVALSCECSRCTVDTSDCTVQSLQPDFCMSQRLDFPAY